MIVGQRNSDLTEGIIWKALIIFTVPILVGNFFQHLYTTADAVIIGRFTGKEGLAAIDSVFSLLKLPVNLFSGLSAGSSILISQLYGAKKYGELSKTIHTALMLTPTTGMPLSVKSMREAERAASLDLNWFVEKKIADEIRTSGRIKERNNFLLSVEIKKEGKIKLNLNTGL